MKGEIYSNIALLTCFLISLKGFVYSKLGSVVEIASLFCLCMYRSLR